MRKGYNYIFSLLILVTLACEREEFYEGANARLRFSVDTLLFDTIFTSIGSATRHMKVYNPYSEDIRISSIHLARAGQSGFRLNIDGISADEMDDVIIRARDSMYVFVEVTIDPLGSNQPLVVQDSIVFITNGNQQDVDLVAWGQDVHLMNGAIIQTQEWNDDKPYLVYHSMLVDTDEVLTIHEGTRVYFHRGSTMYVIGTLVVQGTVDHPVILEGDRLEEMYSNIPGQWNGIYFINGSTANVMENVIVRNAETGIHLGNLFSSFDPPELVLNNAEIGHMTYAGISSISSSITAKNVLVYDCGFYSLLLTTGGSYEFLHCTLANFWSYSNRITPAVALTNFFRIDESTVVTAPLENAFFGNCIIEGRRDTEIGFNELTGHGAFNFYFDHCLVRADEQDVNTSDPLHFGTLFRNTDPGFRSVTAFNFELDTLAFAKDKGLIDIANLVPFDIKGKSRLADLGPDLGAFERIEIK